MQELISRYVTHTSAHVQACYCSGSNQQHNVESSQNADSSESKVQSVENADSNQRQVDKSYVNRLWLSQARYVGKPPTDLVIFLSRVFTNPITGFTQKVERQVTIDSHQLHLSVILHDIKDSTQDTNPNTIASTQFEHENGTNIEYTLVGTADHTGDPKAGHYTNNILNDNSNPEKAYVATNNNIVEYHDDFSRLSKNLIACWFKRI